MAQAIELQIDGRCRVQRQRLADEEAADDGDPERLAELGSFVVAKRQR